jgi:hypothetical protein
MSGDAKSPFHPDNLRMDVGEMQVIVPRKTKWRREHFTMLPGVWKERLTKAKYISTYRLAWHILMRDFETRGEPFTLSNGALTLENVSRGQKWRALEELEQAGLIVIERREHKTPRISALYTATVRRTAKL